MGGWDRRSLIAAPIFLALAVLVACGGGTSQSSPFASVADVCDTASKAERFRYTFSYRLESPKQEGEIDTTVVGEPPFALQAGNADFLFGQRFEGSFESPNMVDVTVQTEGSAAAQDTRFIYIGADQWVELGGEWQPVPTQDIPFAPLEMCNAILSGLDVTDVTPVSETIDGQKVARYEVEDVELETAVTVWSAPSDMGRLLKTFTVTVWLPEDGDAPVRMESKSVGAYPYGRELTMVLTLEIQDIGADDIKIEPPV